MQAKFGAGFVIVGLLYVVVDALVPRLRLDFVSETLLTASIYLGIVFGASWLLARYYSRELRDLVQAAGELSRGDLTREIPVRGRDETAELAQSFFTLRENLTQVVREVQSTAHGINASAQALTSVSTELDESTGEIAATADEIARGAGEQAEQVSRTAKTTTDLASVADGVASRAREVHQSASHAAERSSAGSDDASLAAESIAVLAEKTRSATATVEGFQAMTSEIDKLINSITALSHQTHLLAINAGIEAARAGDAGRGFAVVAEEVSRLADSVRRFAGQIATISESIMLRSSEVVDQFRQSVQAADDVRELVARSATSFEGILDAIESTSNQAEAIFNLTQEHRVSTEDVRRSLVTISSIAARNAAGTREASQSHHEQRRSVSEMNRSAQALAETAVRLQEAVSVFKVREAEIDAGPPTAS